MGLLSPGRRCVLRRSIYHLPRFPICYRLTQTPLVEVHVPRSHVLRVRFGIWVPINTEAPRLACLRLRPASLLPYSRSLFARNGSSARLTFSRAEFCFAAPHRFVSY